jgi:hypothetical protein
MLLEGVRRLLSRHALPQPGQVLEQLELPDPEPALGFLARVDRRALPRGRLRAVVLHRRRVRLSLHDRRVSPTANKAPTQLVLSPLLLLCSLGRGCKKTNLGLRKGAPPS